MKKFVVVSLALCLCIGAVFAQTKGPIAVDFGGGLYYDHAIADTSDPDFGSVAAILNLRGGFYGNLAYRFDSNVAVGGELGLAYMTFTVGSESISFFDIPANALVSYSLGGIKLAGFGGLYLWGAAATNVAAFLAFDVGARVNLGGLFLEYSFVQDLSDSFNFQRFGVGYTYSLL